MDYITHPLPQSGDAIGLEGDMEVDWSRKIDVYDGDNNVTLTAGTTYLFNETDFVKFADVPLTVLCDILLAFGYPFFEKLCRNSMCEFYRMTEHFKPRSACTFNTIRDAAGAQGLEKLFGHPLDVDATARAENNRERAREAVAVNPAGWQGFGTSAANKYKNVTEQMDAIKAEYEDVKSQIYALKLRLNSLQTAHRLLQNQQATVKDHVKLSYNFV